MAIPLRELFVNKRVVALGFITSYVIDLIFNQFLKVTKISGVGHSIDVDFN